MRMTCVNMQTEIELIMANQRTDHSDVLRLHGVFATVVCQLGEARTHLNIVEVRTEISSERAGEAQQLELMSEGGRADL